MNMLNKRKKDVLYTNTTNKVILLTITAINKNATAILDIFINGTNPNIYSYSNSGKRTIYYFVNKGDTYQVSKASSNIIEWDEEEL